MTGNRRSGAPMLTFAAERGWPTTLARIDAMLALHRH